MGKRKTDSSFYKSRYSIESYVTAAQFLTELICEKKAGISNSELPQKFWELSEWNKYFKYQIMLVSRLLQKYETYCLFAALKDSRCRRVYSFRHPGLLKIIEEYANKPKVEKIYKEIPIVENPVFPSNNKAESIVSKLRQLDD